MMKRKKKSSIGCLFWIALILLLIVIFLLSRSRIENVLEATGFKNIFTSDKETSTPVVVRKTEKELDKGTGGTLPETTTEVPSSPVNTQKLPDVDVDIKTPQVNTTIVDKVQTEKKIRKSVLYFVSVSDSGKISLQTVTRSVSFVDSPLTETMKSLINGLTPSELNRGLISLIPDNTELLGISIKNSTAFINFSDSVKFNSFGEEGLLASIKQIVYTATEFPTVSKVQLLINGKVEKYLSTEGIFVGKPISRDSFN